jgi:hypothetical protein
MPPTRVTPVLRRLGQEQERWWLREVVVVVATILSSSSSSSWLTLDITVMIKTRFILSELIYFPMFFGHTEEHV